MVEKTGSPLCVRRQCELLGLNRNRLKVPRQPSLGQEELEMARRIDEIYLRFPEFGSRRMWCADVTYIPLVRGFAYLVAIMDWKTRAVLSWKLSNTLDRTFCVEGPYRDAASHRKAPRDIQHRSGLPIHQQGMGCNSGGLRSACEHGWKMAVDGQCVYRETEASSETRINQNVVRAF